MARAMNFNAGPAALPLSALERAQKELLDLGGTGMSVMEHSHRGKAYEAVHNEAIGLVRELLAVPENYDILLLQGGASQQFAVIPMNLLPAGKSADYILTGSWSQKAYKEAKTLGTVRVAADAPPGVRPVRIWTSQGAASGCGFVVGDLPEVVERELPGDPVAEPVTLPVTANGRIFPREDVDLWAFRLRAGEVVTARVDAARLGSPLDPWIEAHDPDGRRVAEADARLAFTAHRDGTYTVKVHDVGANVPIIAVTASDVANDQQVWAQAGITDCVSKPFVPSALLAKLQQVCTRPHALKV